MWHFSSLAGSATNYSGGSDMEEHKRITKADIRLFHAETGERLDTEDNYHIMTAPELVVVIDDTGWFVVSITQAGLLTHFWLIESQP